MHFKQNTQSNQIDQKATINYTESKFAKNL